MYENEIQFDLFSKKKHKTLSNGTAPIYLRITVDETRVESSAKRFVPPAKWNSAMQKVSGLNEEAKTINTYLKTMEQEVFHAHRILIQENKGVTTTPCLCVNRHYPEAG